MNSIRISLVTALILALGCTAKKAPIETPKTNTSDIISDRPIGSVPGLFVVTLQSPALLASATMSPGGLVISDAAKQQVLAEQAAFEQKLRSSIPAAQVVYRYRLTLNGLAIFSAPEDLPQIMAMAGVKSARNATQFGRPQEVSSVAAPILTSSTTSVSFIGSEAAHLLGFRGQGMRVGILDTGIDYTHSMLGGSGDPAEYKAIDPAQPANVFPNAKVIGGVDLVGTDFNAASPFFANHLPHPDANPLDEAGHGTHVAGTVAGIGDNRQTYSGVAPDAKLYAVKVFGKDGSTSDAVVIAGFEFAADPDGDLNISDRLEVINLSLGGGFGQPQILYTEATRNLTRGGTVVVASAGNSGPTDYIVGAPSTSDDAISIAASVDGSPHTWQFPAVRFTSPTGVWLAKAVEAGFSKPIADIQALEAPLVYIGLADQDLTDEVKAQLNGKTALIERGKVTFVEKARRAFEAGAVGVVVYNNAPGPASAMGGDQKYDIPAIMISQELGLKIRADMEQGEVRIEFKTPEKIFEPELIDTITSFSSKGPRSEDNLLKPEIAAPGESITSAAMGEGRAAVRMSGTSMAAPHMSGVMALLRQAHPDLTVAELKSLAMGTSHTLPNIPMTLQGAGRIQLDKAIQAKVLVEPASISLGRVQVGTPRRRSQTLSIKNLGDEDLALSFGAMATAGLRLNMPPALTVPAHSQISVNVDIEVVLSPADTFASELEARIYLQSGRQVLTQVPVLALATQSTTIQGGSLGATSVTLTNSSPMKGFALPFNLIGQDARKEATNIRNLWRSRSCDMSTAGYRIVERAGQSGPESFLQIGVKLHTPVTTWVGCEISALLDADGDGVAEQEIAGTIGTSVGGVGVGKFVSMLLDAQVARGIRLTYETELSTGKETDLDYQPAILAVAGMAPFPQSTLAVIEAPLNLLAKGSDQKLHVKIGTLSGDDDALERDDFFGASPLGDWTTIPTTAGEQGFVGLEELIPMNGGGQAQVSYQRGSGTEKLVIFYPNNEVTPTGTATQEQIY
ncbi:MAG: S8 family serine peptidase [Bdellovibrionales bacterium]